MAGVRKVHEQSYLLRHEHMNGAGRLFGGTLMAWIDDIAGIAARSYSGRDVTTACVDHLNFLEGARLNDMIVLTAQVSYVGSTSMEVTVKTWCEKLDGSRDLVNAAYLVMVAMDENGRPCPAPAFTPETEAEKEEWEAAHQRYLLRKERQKQERRR